MRIIEEFDSKHADALSNARFILYTHLHDKGIRGNFRIKKLENYVDVRM